ncbi:MAG: hypothetical protein LBD20_06640 [Spirochaetaceae bacterium]|jgi:hypothetical protein|nr:hypothetical protein [Spirochaetaceae bacterium]
MKPFTFTKKLYCLAGALLVLAFFSCDDLIKDAGEKPWDGPAAVWKVLWAIYPETEFPNMVGGLYTTGMTADEIELVKAKAPWFEAFVETAARGALDIQITIEVMPTPLAVPAPTLPPMPAADKTRLDPEKNFDSCIMTADFTGVEIPWRAINGGFYMLIPFKKDQWGWTYDTVPGDSADWTKMYHTNLYVHEWCHLLEWHFGSRLKYDMPVLHNDTTEYAYTEANTNLDGEYRLVKWYSDFIAGTIASYPGATNNKKGVHPSWWQKTPRSLR